MSRIARKAINIPDGVKIKQEGQNIKVSGPKGELSLKVSDLLVVTEADKQLKVDIKQDNKRAWSLAATTRSLLNNMVIGASQGYERKLILNGVGYRAETRGKALNLTLGLSHPISYDLPDGIKASTPSQTEIVLSGVDKQQVGQVAADIRSLRPPEPYKGKGVRYEDEHIRRKEAKKK